ncbi:hypothetical protein J4E89_007550 [Alternaria sp. Ai002NY15]|nr:hypothetical protein J4E89_007550 [Alternaria sp. Ai002NY15]
MTPILMDNKFHERVFPYQWLTKLHLTIKIDDITAQTYEANYGNNWVIDQERAEGIECEERRLKNLYEKLDSSFALLLKRDRLATFSSLKIHIMLELEHYPYTDSPDTETRIAMLNCERGFLNVLEVMRKPVYGLIHAGANVVITWDEEMDGYQCCDPFIDQKPIPGLFHLSKKAWKKVCSGFILITITRMTFGVHSTNF